LKKKDNLILVGMPASGKSTVGVILAKLLGMDFVDTDLEKESLFLKALYGYLPYT
jgi:shikimate kinase